MKWCGDFMAGRYGLVSWFAILPGTAIPLKNRRSNVSQYSAILFFDLLQKFKFGGSYKWKIIRFHGYHRYQEKVIKRLWIKMF